MSTENPRNRKQHGQIIRIGDRWYVRHWERRNIGGTIERKRVTHPLGVATTRGKTPPAEIKAAAEDHLATANNGPIVPERIVTIADFVERVYIPWVKQYKRPSTAKGYRDVWEDHLKALCADTWLKNTRTYHIQELLNTIGKTGKLSRNTLRHIKSIVSGIFTLAKQQDYFQGENPARDTTIHPGAAEPQETYAYTLEDVRIILSLLPEPAGTAFAVAAFTGLRHGEIQGLLWENYRNGEIQVSRSIWNGKVTAPKTRKSHAAVPVIRQLAERLELHRFRCGNPQSGPMFANSVGRPLNLNNLLARVILPALNRCEVCGESDSQHGDAMHEFKRDQKYPEWRGWHAARRGLGSNLYRLGVPDIVIQHILRYANVSTTAAYYIKTTTLDVRNAMNTLETHIPSNPETLTDTYGTLKLDAGKLSTRVN